jgi:hypothetical protein
MATMSHPHPLTLESRLAGWVLQHATAQSFSFRSVTVLLAIERGDANVNPADAHRLLQVALQSCIEAEILAGRKAAR